MTVLKVGDRVRMTEAGKRAWSNSSINPHSREGVVSHLGEVWIQVKWDGGCHNSYKEGQLELVIPFRIGDRVVLTEVGSVRYARQSGGSTGTITSVGEWSWVKWDNGNSNNYQVVHLKVVVEEIKTPEAPQKEKKMFKGKEKTYVDRDGDQFEVDTATSKEYVYFTTGENGEDGIDDGTIVRMDAEQVGKIRKQLGKWLDKRSEIA